MQQGQSQLMLRFKKIVLFGGQISEAIDYFGRNVRPLFLAIQNDDISAINFCISNGVELNKIYDSKTPLIWAIEEQKPQVILFFVKLLEVNICKRDDKGNPPLAFAVWSRNRNIIELLLNNGAGTNLQTAFLEAIRLKDLDITNYFIERGALVNFQYKVGYRRTPLLEAIHTTNFDLVEILLKNGADPNLMGLNNTLPLTASIRKKDLDLVIFLVENGADLDLVEPGGQSPLTCSIKNETFLIIEFLVEQGANINMPDNKNKFPLTELISLEKLKIVQYLVEKGADVNIVDAKQHNPPSVAADKLNIPIFEYLVESGASVESARNKLEEIADRDDDFSVYFETKHPRPAGAVSGSGHE